MFFRSCIVTLVLIATARCGTGPASDDPSPAKSPEDELLTFRLPSDLQIQLVAAEPMVEDPVFMQFDEDGRLWVVEMRGFMPDIDGNGEDDPTGRVSILEDDDGDGAMDKSTIYIDSLIMPRTLAVVKGGALIVEDYKLWMTQDTNGDLVADSKVLIDSTYGGTRLPEHSANGLWRGIDNWYYNARSMLRYRFEGDKIIRDSTEFRGQWGMSHDDQGRLYYNYNWSQLHADLVPPNYLYANKYHTSTSGIDHGLTLDRRVYPIRSNPAVNRGYIPGTLDEDGKLLEFTAACSPYVLRSLALGDQYYGNVFVCEPSGNLVKRNVVTEVGHNLKAEDPNPGHEFLASTDERFRPVFISSGPDGALYVVDMYRGLVQHGEYVTPYLRDQTLKRKLDAPIHYGRIWRVVPNDWMSTKPERLSRKTSAGLMMLLNEQNGWVRDMAQRLLVERGGESAVGAISSMAGRSGEFGPMARFHALWILDALHGNNRDSLLQTLHDRFSFQGPETALRMLERHTADPAFRSKLGNELLTMIDSGEVISSLQLALSARYLDPKHSFPIYKYVLEERDTPVALMPDAVLSGLRGKELLFFRDLLMDKDWKEGDGFKTIFVENLSTIILKRRKPAEISELFAAVSKTGSYFKDAVLTAATVQGRGKWDPLRLPSSPVIFSTLPPEQATIVNNMFEWPGHKVDTESIKATIKLPEAQQKLFADGRQQYLGVCAGCHGTDGRGIQRLAPPLAGSEWVLGSEQRLALLVLHGIEGPIDVAGKRYDAPDILPVMPSHSTMDDGAITSILVYIRNEWGNNAGPVNRRTVGRLRHTTQGRVQPWSAEGLNEHIRKIDTVKTE